MHMHRHDYKASFDSTWRSDLCITKHLMENITRCICPLSGTYVVMLTKRQPHVSRDHSMQAKLIIRNLIAASHSMSNSFTFASRGEQSFNSKFLDRRLRNSM